jgi:peptidoglycan/LPS O-acetylase OafA/YrhL
MKQKLEWLEAMRGCAAIWVLLHHANQTVSTFIGSSGIDQVVLRNGYLGVDFFFVLSGFIIAYSSNGLLQTGRGVVDYAKARSIRIYVPYLPVGIAMLALYQIFPEVSAGDRSPGILTSLTLLPATSPPALSVAWTLIHEMVFYAIFSLIFISRRVLWVVLVLWATLIAIQFLTRPPLGREGWGYILSPLNLCFLLGVAIYYLTRKGVPTRIAIVSAMFGLAVLVIEGTRAAPDRWLLALGFAGLIVCAASGWAQKRNPGRIMLLAGAASYSIYLVHNPVLSVAARVMTRFFPALAPVPALLAIGSIALAGGLLYHLLYERRGLALARGYLSGKRQGVEVRP